MSAVVLGTRIAVGAFALGPTAAGSPPAPASAAGGVARITQRHKQRLRRYLAGLAAAADADDPAALATQLLLLMDLGWQFPAFPRVAAGLAGGSGSRSRSEGWRPGWPERRPLAQRLGMADMNPAVDGATPLIVLIADLVYFGARLGRGRRRPGR